MEEKKNMGPAMDLGQSQPEAGQRDPKMDAGQQDSKAAAERRDPKTAAERQDPKVAAEQDLADGRGKVSETWAEETIADLDDWIESQGIYIRQ